MAFNLPTFDVKYTRNWRKKTQKSQLSSQFWYIIKH